MGEEKFKIGKEKAHGRIKKDEKSKTKAGREKRKPR